MPFAAMAETRKAPRNHVFIIDGTLSRVDDDTCLTHPGRLHAMLSGGGAGLRQTLGYDRGVQGTGLSKWIDAAIGRGFNDSVIAGYAALASRYRPGDRIFLFGFSRGAYAVRSIAGLIDRVGLLRRGEATERNVQRAFRYYRRAERTAATQAFARDSCHAAVDIACIGAWDTVKALGLPYPLLSRVFPMAAEFHDHELGPSVRAAYHALAIDEDRTAYAPILWERGVWTGHLEQVWFPGTHGDIGGERNCLIPPIPLTNISFVWMLERAEAQGLILPEGWRAAFPVDPAAPMAGSRTGINRLFLIRRPRAAAPGADGQAVHDSVGARTAQVRGYRPLAEGIKPPVPTARTPLDIPHG